MNKTTYLQLLNYLNKVVTTGFKQYKDNCSLINFKKDNNQLEVLALLEAYFYKGSDLFSIDKASTIIANRTLFDNVIGFKEYYDLVLKHYKKYFNLNLGIKEREKDFFDFIDTNHLISYLAYSSKYIKLGTLTKVFQLKTAINVLNNFIQQNKFISIKDKYILAGIYVYLVIKLIKPFTFYNGILSQLIMNHILAIGGLQPILVTNYLLANYIIPINGLDFGVKIKYQIKLLEYIFNYQCNFKYSISYDNLDSIYHNHFNYYYNKNSNRDLLYLILPFENGDYIVFSDLHIFHDNIFCYEHETRTKINKLLQIDNFNWDIFSRKFIDHLISGTIINLGDFLFHLGEEKFKKYKDVIKLWGGLADNMIVILGNHDLNKNKKLNEIEYALTGNILSKPKALIFDLFKVKAFHIIENKNTTFILSHYPIGYFNLNKKEENNFFYKLDKFLQENYIHNSNKNIINIHGHMHSKEFKGLDNVFYVNACVDKLVK